MRFIYIMLGIIFTALGAVGVILPILPTTPFLLLALACFGRGSKRFNDYFRSTKLYKNNVEEFVNDRSMTLKNKILILSFASIMLMIPLMLVDKLWVKVFIIFLIIYKYYYFTFEIKTSREDDIKLT